MALDEPRDDDETMDNNGITYLVNKDLFEQVKPISVDYAESAMGAGFMIRSNMSMASGGGSCGSCSSCG